MLVNTTSARSSQPKTDFVAACLQSLFTGCWWRLWFGGQRECRGSPQVRSFPFPWRSVKSHTFFPQERPVSEWNVGQDSHYLRKLSVCFFERSVIHFPQDPLLPISAYLLPYCSKTLPPPLLLGTHLVLTPIQKSHVTPSWPEISPKAVKELWSNTMG